MAVISTKKVANFRPSEHGFQFVNRFPGFPLPKALGKLIDTSKSVHGLCGGMCFGVIDYISNGMELPKIKDIPEQGSLLYEYLAERQFASWGRMNLMVFKYIRWMAYSDERAQAETLESWLSLRYKLAGGRFAVIGLIYKDFRESVRVWDNHQVLAYGYEVMSDGTIRILLYDPNYPGDDSIALVITPTTLKNGHRGMQGAQYRGDQRIHEVHAFLNVPYRPKTPPPFESSVLGH